MGSPVRRVNLPMSYGDSYPLLLENQVTPFNFTTSDYETIYAWHVLPLGLYAKHEKEIIQQPSGLTEDVTKTVSFRLLREDPNSKLVISCKLRDLASRNPVC